MNLKKALSTDTVTLDLKGNTKEEIIEELIDLLATAGKVHNRNDAVKAVLERENKMSTGMQNGIAIPHGKTDKVDHLVAAVGIKKEGVDFGSMDGKPSRIFVITLSPDSRTGPHIQFLAEISRKLSNPVICERILQAGSPEELLNILLG